MPSIHLSRMVLTTAAAVSLMGAACSSGTAGAPGASATAEPATPISGSAIPEIATDNVFNMTNIAISANQAYTLTLTNKGEALHNWHVLGAKSADGKEIESPLVEGGKTATLNFSIPKPGSYRFQCDVHPDTMKGTITVR
jgi:plastocyanin